MADLKQVLTVEEARKILTMEMTVKRAEAKLPVLQSLGRCLASNVLAREDVPGFDRSTMDGFAVRARDTYGASEGLPSYVDVSGEVLMGQEPRGEIGPGQAWRIATGGMLPSGADAVVMVEYTEDLDGQTVGITRPAAPGENIVRRGEDIAAGGIALTAGHRIRPQDLGMLSSVGATEVPVLLPARVGIISAGDDLAGPINCSPQSLSSSDISSNIIFGSAAACGGKSRIYRFTRDDFTDLKRALKRAAEENDLVFLCVDISASVSDIIFRAIDSTGQPGVLFHGLSISPGSTTAGAVIDGKPVFVMPVQPVAAMIVFELLAAPLIQAGGYPDELESGLEFPLRAVLTHGLSSSAGLEEFIVVRVTSREGVLLSEPVLVMSGMIQAMIQADGLARIPAGSKVLKAGDTVEVKLF